MSSAIPSPVGFKLRFPLKRVTVVLFLLVAAIVGYQGWRALHISHAVAMHNIACDLVRSYVIKHDGQWPKSWSDLADVDGAEATCDLIRHRIVIDFQADPRHVARQSASDFDAIRFVDPQLSRYRDERTIERLIGLLQTYQSHDPREPDGDDAAPGPVRSDKPKEPSIEVGRPVTEMFAALRERKIEWREERFAEAQVRGSPPNSDIADVVFDLGEEVVARIYYSETRRVVTGISIIVRPANAGRKYHSTFAASRIQLEADGSFSVRFSPHPKPPTR